MRDSQWMRPAVILLLAQHAAAWGLSSAIGFGGRPPTFNYMVLALALSLAGGILNLLRNLWSMWARGEAQPAQRLIAETDHAAVVAYLVGFQLVALQIAALTWLKEMLPLIAPFWADPPLASLDRAILGVDAWRAVPLTLVRPLDTLYTLWAPAKLCGLLLIIARPASQLKSRAMLAYFLTVGLLGVGGQYLLSSAGPVFHDRLVGGSDFADLTARLRSHAPIASLAGSYLWQAYVVRDAAFGAGISAMPSIHVATTAWMALAVGSVWPRARPALWAFWLVIMIGSIALGWHYLTDGVAGTAGALLCWWLAGRYCQSRCGLPVNVPAPATG